MQSQLKETQNKKLYYQVGKANFDKNRVDWGNSDSEPQPYSKGHRPRVAIKNNNLIVTVHESSEKKRCYYRVGVVKQEIGIIAWVSSSARTLGSELNTEFGEGSFPGVAINDNNTVILTYRCADEEAITYCRVGKIDTKSMYINYKSGIPIKLFAKKLMVAVNNNGKVVATYLREDYKCIYCMAGKLNEDLSIEWEKHYLQTLANADGEYKPARPVVSIDSKGYFVVVHSPVKLERSAKLKYKMTCNVGFVQFCDNKSRVEIFNSENRYDTGLYPAVAINDDKRIVEVHEWLWKDGDGKDKFFYLLGKTCTQDE